MRSILPLAAACVFLAGCAPKVVATPANLPHASAAGMEKVRLLPAPYRTGDPVAGRDVYALCAGCHGLSPGQPQEKGPLLTGFLDREAASRPDYAYSEALRESGIVWDLRRLDRWLFNPQEALPGSSMAFIGVRNDRKRYDLIAYLAAVSDQPPP